MAQSVASHPTGVTWRLIAPFCGRFESEEAKAFPVESATIKLYRAKEKHLPCCQSAESLGDVKVDKDGNFDLRALPSGEYWIVSSWDRAQVSVPVWVNKKSSYACDKNSYTSIELTPSAGTFEITMQTSIN
jgi:hypothetical protein